jgi:broad specificity polyphosphatase/5'/3'-nucleotidase SurE
LANLLGKRNKEAPFLLNVNFPPREIEGIKGVELTTLGPKAYLENVEEVKSGRRTYFWLHHNKATGAPLEKGTDVWAINNEKVSITVIDPYLSTLNGYSRCEDFVNVAEASLSMN